MIEPQEVKKLAALARIALSEAEETKLSQDLESILAYVSDLKSAPKIEATDQYYVKNVTAPDLPTGQPGEFTDEILAEAPQRAGNYFKVKKIFN